MQNEEDNVALFDMDESLAAYTPTMVRDLERLRSPGEEPLTEANIWVLDRMEHIQARMELIKSQPGWWLNLPPIHAGLKVVRWCQSSGFDIGVLTKGPKKHALAWGRNSCGASDTSGLTLT